MKQITCIAIDDEPMALLVIEQFCQRMGNISLSCYSEPRVGLCAIKEESPDLVFLDIQMNSINGLELAKQLSSDSCFIFTTAYSQYALNGFDLDAVDFLLKPFSYERFVKAVEKAIRRIDAQPSAPPDALIVKQEYCNVAIPLKDITYIEALGNYSKIFRLKDNYVLTHTNMKTILSMLPSNKFTRIHKSYIIALDKVEKFTKDSVKIINKKDFLPIGKKYRIEKD